MPRLIITRGALAGINRCQRFLLKKDHGAAQRAGAVIGAGLARLKTMPSIGRPAARAAGMRELPIKFGSSGYIALYSYDVKTDIVYVLALRHQREAEY